MISDGFVDNQNSFYSHYQGKNLTKVAVLLWWFYILCKKLQMLRAAVEVTRWYLIHCAVLSLLPLSCQSSRGYGRPDPPLSGKMLFYLQGPTTLDHEWLFDYVQMFIIIQTYTESNTTHYTAEYCIVIQSECWWMQTKYTIFNCI